MANERLLFTVFWLNITFIAVHSGERCGPWASGFLSQPLIFFKCLCLSDRHVLGLSKTKFPRILTPVGQRGQPYPQLALSPVPDHCLSFYFDFGVGYPEVRTTFSHMATPLVLYHEFLDKTNFPRTLTQRARYPQDTSIIPTRSRP